jgi:hypothetical protein
MFRTYEGNSILKIKFMANAFISLFQHKINAYYIIHNSIGMTKEPYAQAGFEPKT